MLTLKSPASPQAPDADTLERLAQATQQVGLFAVTGLNAHSENSVVGEALQAFVRCDGDGHLQGLTLEVEMHDQTTRRTLATSTNSSVPQPLPSRVLTLCPEFARASSSLRDAVAATGHAYALILDQLVYGTSPIASSPGPFASAATYAESLEHFHVFRRHPALGLGERSRQQGRDVNGGQEEHPSRFQTGPTHNFHCCSCTGVSTERPMLPMHSDVGLFLVMSVAEAFDLATSERLQADQLLLLELPSGQIVRPVLPAGSLLVMNGEGSKLWVPTPMGHTVQPWAPAHEVAAMGWHGVDWARSWFGRMYFPPRSARLRGSANVTFGDYRQHTYQAFNHGEQSESGTLSSVPAVAGCSPSRRLLADEGSCGADEVRGLHVTWEGTGCWHNQF